MVYKGGESVVLNEIIYKAKVLRCFPLEGNFLTTDRSLKEVMLC